VYVPLLTDEWPSSSTSTSYSLTPGGKGSGEVAMIDVTPVA
jgi:hypothetical protein